MDRRRNRRVAVFLTVQVWGVDAKSMAFVQHAQAKNISDRGAVLQGITRPLKAGSILHVQHNKDQAQFRIVWVGRSGSRRQGEVGLESLPSEPSLWDANLLRCGPVEEKG